MAIGKRFTHLNNSGSNHKILDAESAYITGTLQVGPSIPVLGADTNFFVSGIIGGAGGGTPGVGVFGGDLVVSGTIYGLDGVVGGEQYWASEAAGEIFTSASLVNVPSGSVHAQFLSASNGVEVTGSVLFDLTQAPYVSFVISGAEQSFVPYLDIVHNSTNYLTTYSYMTVDPTGSGLVLQNFDGGRQIRLDPYGFGDGEVKITSGSREIYLAANYNGSDIPALWLSPDSSAPTGSIVVEDNNNQPADLDLVIRALKLNGDPGVAGYVLTSSGDGVAPGWAAFPTGGANYWSEEVAGQLFTSASIVHVPSGSVRAQFLSASNGAEVSGSAIFAGAGGVTVGSDTVFFVSGAIDGVSAGNGVAAFGGDLFVSGNMYVSGYTELWGDTDIGKSGIGASLQIYTNDPQTTINLNVGNDKAIKVANTTLYDDVEITSGSIILRQDYNSSGEKPVLTVEANRIAYTVSTGGAADTLGITSAGALSLSASNGLKVTGSAVFTGGITGSLNWIDEAGTVPFLVAGPNTTVNFNNGQWEITGSDEAQPEWYYTANVGEIGTSGSAAITGSLSVATAGTGRGLLKFGGLDIGPITGSLTLTGSIQTGYALGNVLSASFGAGPNAVVEHELHVLAVGREANTSSIDHFFSATYVVTSKINNAGVQSLIGSIELTREAEGTYSNQWDVNVESDMKVAVTGTMNGGVQNAVQWFVERTRERSKKFL